MGPRAREPRRSVSARRGGGLMRRSDAPPQRRSMSCRASPRLPTVSFASAGDDRVDRLLAETPELDDPLVLERDVAAALGELLDDCRREDLACPRVFCYTRGERDVATVEIVVLAHSVAGVHTDADADGAVGMVAELSPDRPLD